jgi:hypothetical protein
VGLAAESFDALLARLAWFGREVIAPITATAGDEAC